MLATTGFLGPEDLQGLRDHQVPGDRQGLEDLQDLEDRQGLGLHLLLHLVDPLGLHEDGEGLPHPGLHLGPLVALHPRELAFPQDSEARKDHQHPEALVTAQGVVYLGLQGWVLGYPAHGRSQPQCFPVGPLWHAPSWPKLRPIVHHNSGHPPQALKAPGGTESTSLLELYHDNTVLPCHTPGTW